MIGSNTQGVLFVKLCLQEERAIDLSNIKFREPGLPLSVENDDDLTKKYFQWSGKGEWPLKVVLREMGKAELERV